MTAAELLSLPALKELGLLVFLDPSDDPEVLVLNVPEVVFLRQRLPAALELVDENILDIADVEDEFLLLFCFRNLFHFWPDSG